MKHTLFLVALLVSLGISSQNVHIPDTNFKNALLSHNPRIDTDRNGEISVVEAQDYKKEITVYHKQIKNLTGIEAFVNITNLKCNYNKLTSLDLSNNTKLTTLNCSDNNLTSLKLGVNTSLVSLICSYNKLASLDVRKNTALTILDCSYNQLTSLDVSQNTAFQYLYCNDNKLISLDVRKNTKLTELNCRMNQLKSLDVRKNTLLTGLSCGNNQLTSLGVSQNTALTILNCSYNQLTSLDISQNTALGILYCENNNLTSLNLANGKNQDINDMSATDNPNLKCIQTDANLNLSSNQYWEKDATANYNTNCSLGVDDIELNSQEVSIYPNPVQDVLNVALAHSKVKSVVVYNVLGAEVLRSTSSSIAVQSLPSGIYIVKVEDIKGRKFANKIVKK